jgi:outer membrane immunogenic protein
VNAKYSISNDFYGDLTARLGYLMGSTLFYVKGGGAGLDADFKAKYAGQNCLSISPKADASCSSKGYGATSPFNYDHSGMLVGWTAGAGVEYKISPSWSFKAEYQHFDFGSMSYSYSGCYAVPGFNTTCPAGAQPYANHYTSTITGKTEVSVTADAVTLGFNYHLSNDAELK